jgi:hypothetical protein
MATNTGIFQGLAEFDARQGVDKLVRYSRASELRMADALLIKTLVVILASVCAISLVAHIRLPAAAYRAAWFASHRHER